MRWPLAFSNLVWLVCVVLLVPLLALLGFPNRSLLIVASLLAFIVWIGLNRTFYLGLYERLRRKTGRRW